LGGWRRHVDQVRARLAISYGGDEITDDAAAQIARSASDIDASRLQIETAGFSAGMAPYQQAIARARGAADRLLASSRHALDASDPVTAAWRDVHAGCRLAAAIM
jgi:3-hydroxy-9,10-secoandrosta-1,3,5(10)-triene-9,17-dione monooxygenase